MNSNAISKAIIFILLIIIGIFGGIIGYLKIDKEMSIQYQYRTFIHLYDIDFVDSQKQADEALQKLIDKGWEPVLMTSASIPGDHNVNTILLRSKSSD